MGDVIDRIIAGERVTTLSRQDIADVWAWLDDPRNGVAQPMHRLITLLVYELCKGRPPPGYAFDNDGEMYRVG
jgi:hypothetical protein